MNEIKPTLGQYGELYQVKLLNEILTSGDKNNYFFKEVIKDIKCYHFSDKILRKIISLVKSYYRKYNEQPTINSILLLTKSEITNKNNRVKIINKMDRIQYVNNQRNNGILFDDSNIIKKQLLTFIERQKMLKLLDKNS